MLGLVALTSWNASRSAPVDMLKEGVRCLGLLLLRAPPRQSQSCREKLLAQGQVGGSPQLWLFLVMSASSLALIQCSWGVGLEALVAAFS